jgi:hypothetical protein
VQKINEKSKNNMEVRDFNKENEKEFKRFLPN